METNDPTQPDSRKRRSWRGESATEAREDTAAAPAPTPDAVEPSAQADVPTAPVAKPELTERKAWKRRRAIALGLIKP
jgi:hypothetical protein